MRGRVVSGSTTIGLFVIKFDGAVIFTMTGGGSFGDALKKAQQLRTTVELVLDPESIEDV